MKRIRQGAGEVAASPLGLDAVAVKRLSKRQQRFRKEAKYNPLEPDLPVLLERLAQVRKLVAQVITQLKKPSPAAAKAMIEALDVLRDLTSGDSQETDLWGHLDTVGWAIAGAGSADKYFAYERASEDRGRARIAALTPEAES